MPDAVPIPTEGVVALPVTKDVTLLRGVCKERLKYEIEYALKRGTTENAYLINVPAAAPGGPRSSVLVDVPFKAFQEDFGARGERQRGRGERLAAAGGARGAAAGGRACVGVWRGDGAAAARSHPPKRGCAAAANARIALIEAPADASPLPHLARAPAAPRSRVPGAAGRPVHPQHHHHHAHGPQPDPHACGGAVQGARQAPALGAAAAAGDQQPAAQGAAGKHAG